MFPLNMMIYHSQVSLPEGTQCRKDHRRSPCSISLGWSIMIYPCCHFFCPPFLELVLLQPSEVRVPMDSHGLPAPQAEGFWLIASTQEMPWCFKATSSWSSSEPLGMEIDFTYLKLSWKKKPLVQPLKYIGNMCHVGWELLIARWVVVVKSAPRMSLMCCGMPHIGSI